MMLEQSGRLGRRGGRYVMSRAILATPSIEATPDAPGLSTANKRTFRAFLRASQQLSGESHVDGDKPHPTIVR